MTPAPEEALLVVVDRRADKASRARVALACGLAFLASMALVVRAYLLDLPWPIGILPLTIGALALAGRAGAFERARALMAHGSIRRDGLRATEMLGAGDIAGAKQAY